MLIFSLYISFLLLVEQLQAVYIKPYAVNVAFFLCLSSVTWMLHRRGAAVASRAFLRGALLGTNWRREVTTAACGCCACVFVR